MFEPVACCTTAFCIEIKSGSFSKLPQKGLYALWLSEGSCMLSDADSTQLLQRDTLVLFVHSGSTQLDGDTCSGLLCCLTGTAAESFADSLAAPTLYPLPRCQESVTLLSEISLLYPAGQTARLSAASYVFLCSLPQAESSAAAESPLVKGAVAAIRANYDKLYGVEELAQGLGVTKNHLVRVFHAAVGITPGRYLTLTRLEAAKRLLCRPGYTLDVVAALSGFSGAGYLCRVFKQETGMTPAKYRAVHLPDTPAENAQDGHWTF